MTREDILKKMLTEGWNLREMRLGIAIYISEEQDYDNQAWRRRIMKLTGCSRSVLSKSISKIRNKLGNSPGEISVKSLDIEGQKVDVVAKLETNCCQIGNNPGENVAKLETKGPVEIKSIKNIYNKDTKVSFNIVQKDVAKLETPPIGSIESFKIGDNHEKNKCLAAQVVFGNDEHKEILSDYLNIWKGARMDTWEGIAPNKLKDILRELRDIFQEKTSYSGYNAEKIKIKGLSRKEMIMAMDLAIRKNKQRAKSHNWFKWLLCDKIVHKIGPKEADKATKLTSWT